MKRIMTIWMAWMVAALLASVVPAVAAPDTFEGDTAIYTLAASKIPANVLFLIDNSQTGERIASGEQYNPSTTYDSHVTNDSDAVFVMDNQGDFSKVVLNAYTDLKAEDCWLQVDANGDPVLTGGVQLNMAAVIERSLFINGTYSGAGTTASPGINAAKDICSTKDSGVYAIGNYLNYMQTPPENIRRVFQYDSVDPTKKNWYTLNYEHRSSSKLSPSLDPTTETWYVDVQGLTAVPDGVNPLTKLWLSDASIPDEAQEVIDDYVAANSPDATQLEQFIVKNFLWRKRRLYSLEGKEQIKLIFHAIENVVGGFRNGTVRFGAMTYNFNQKGGHLLYPITDLTTQDEYEAFIASLPKVPLSEPKGDLLNSNTARPAVGAMVDALHYYQGFKGKLPYGQEDNVDVFDDPRPSPIEFYCQPNYIIYISNGATFESIPDTSWFEQMEVEEQDPNYPDDPTKTITVGGTSNCGDVDGDGWENGDCKSTSAYDDGSHYLDDLAYWMRKSDMFTPAMVADTAGYHQISGTDMPGKQIIETGTIKAFLQSEPLLERTGANGGLGSFTANNSYELQRDLSAMLGNIVREANATFIAPVVPASPENRIRSGRRIYLGFFKPESRKMWLGNLKKYIINEDGDILALDGTDPSLEVPWDQAGSKSLWSTTVDVNNVEAGGVGAKVKLQATNDTRNIYTFFGGDPDLTVTENLFHTDNLVKVKTELALASEGEARDLINLVRGRDKQPDNTYKEKPWVLGDILHSKPNVFNYNSYDFIEANENNGPDGDDWAAACVPDPNDSNSTDCNKTVIFVGGNDGMLHAYADYNGKELWGYVPPNLQDDLALLSDEEHTYYVDGSPIIYARDQNKDKQFLAADGDYVILVFGTRRGGGQDTLNPALSRGAYHALDVTTPNKPKFLFSIDANGITRAEGSVIKTYASTDGDQYNYSELGETWSTPFIRRIKVDGSERIAMFIGAGYDNNEDQRWGSTQQFPLSTDPALKPVQIAEPIDNPAQAFDLPTSSSVIPKLDGNGDPVLDSFGNPVETVSAYYEDGCRSDTSQCGQVEPRGRGLYVVEIASINTDAGQTRNFSDTGEKIWGYTHTDHHSDTTSHDLNAALTYSFPADVRVIDQDSNDLADRIYASDTGGRLWRFDIGDNSRANWTAKKVFDANGTTADSSKGRKFFYSPEYDIVNQNLVNVFLGSGDRAHPLNYLDDIANAATGGVLDRLYMIKDYTTDTSALPPTPIVEGSGGTAPLVDLTDNPLQNPTYTAAEQTLVRFQLQNDPWVDDGNGNFGKYGWYMKLVAAPGEKALSPPQEILGLLLQTTYAPNLTIDDPCEAGNQGAARFYALKAATGEAFLDMDGDGDVDMDDRNVYVGGGIPPEPTIIVTAKGVKAIIISEDTTVDDKIAQTKLTGINVGEIETIVPVYWMQW